LKKTISLALGLLAFTTMNAQNTSCKNKISGVVLDSFDQVALSNTLVSIDSLGQETKTDNKGQFTLSGLCPGRHEVHISHLNCEHIHIVLDVRSDTFVKIFLRHIEKELIGFKLSAKQEKPDELNHLNGKNMDYRRGQSISSLMQDIAGISLLKTGASVGKPMVNGLFGNRVIIVNNGIRLEGQNWGMEHAPEIDAFLASEIDLIKGAESLRYGADGIGGVIRISPKSVFSEKPKTLNGEINLIGNSNGRGKTGNIILGGVLSKKLPLFIRVQSSLKQFGNIKTARDFLANTGMSEFNYSFHLGYQRKGFQTELFYSEFHNKIGIYTGSQVGNLSDLEKAMNSKTPLIKANFTYQIDRAYQLVQHRMLKLKNSLQINAKNKIDLTLSYQRNHREEYDVLRSSNSFTGPSFDYYISSSFAELVWTKNPFHQINWQAGLIGLRQSNAYTGRFFIPGFYQNSFTGFVMVSRQYKKLGIEGSVRYDQKHFEIFRWIGSVSNKTQLLYSGLAYVLKAEYTLSGKEKISFIQSSTWRAPAPNELYSNGLHQGLASIEIGDSALKTERSYSQSMSYSVLLKKHKLDIEGYYQIVDGYINLVPSNKVILTIRGAYPVFEYQQNKAALYGLNARWKYQIGKSMYTVISGQLPYGQNIDTKNALNLMPSANGKLGVGYKHKTLNVDVWLNYQSKQNRYVVGSDFMPPPEAYALIGFALNYEFKAVGQNFKCGLTGSNIGNCSYRDYLNRFRYFTDEPGLNISAKLTMNINQNQTK